ncbi:MAG TPA: AAA family ATPase [Streptosporangiaceae bacterium]
MDFEHRQVPRRSLEHDPDPGEGCVPYLPGRRRAPNKVRKAAMSSRDRVRSSMALNTRSMLEAELRGRGHDAREHAGPRGLRLDQAAAIWHVLTSPRTVEIVTGPAGTGKTWVLATAASVWDGPVFGTATSQNAANELRAAGVQTAANTTRLLADLTDGRIPPGSLILADEGSMVSITHLAAVVSYAARNGCKLVLAGDQEQLAAVEGGGAMMLLAMRVTWISCASLSTARPVTIPQIDCLLDLLIRRSMGCVRPVRRNPHPQVSVLPSVRHRRRSPVPSGQSVRKL